MLRKAYISYLISPLFLRTYHTKVYIGRREDHIVIRRIWFLVITPYLAITKKPKWIPLSRVALWEAKGDCKSPMSRGRKVSKKVETKSVKF